MDRRALISTIYGKYTERLLLDNHASFTGYDLRLLCARMSIYLVHSKPGDAPSKGKIERFYAHLPIRRTHRSLRLVLSPAEALMATLQD